MISDSRGFAVPFGQICRRFKGSGRIIRGMSSDPIGDRTSSSNWSDEADDVGSFEKIGLEDLKRDRAEEIADKDGLTPEQVLENKGRSIIPTTTESGLKPDIHYPDGNDEKPGEFPYTRGTYPKQHRSKLWASRVVPSETIFEDTEYGVTDLIDEGVISTAMSHPASEAVDMCVDPDHPLARYQGCSQPVNPAVLDQVPGNRYANPPIERIVEEGLVYEYAHANGSEIWAVTQHLAYLEEQGIPIERLRGSAVNDPLNHHATIECKDGQPWDVMYRFGTDLMEFAFDNVPKLRPTNAGNGYDIREAGVDVFEELAFRFAAYIEYMDEMIDRGLDFEDIHYKPPIALSGDVDFFETVCKIRAARRMHSEICVERYGLDPEDVRCPPANTNAAGRAMTEGNHVTNIVRDTIVALASVMGGVNGMEVKCYTEADSPAPGEAWELNEKSLRGVIAHESGVPMVADPLGGSGYVEELTDEIHHRSTMLLDDILQRGGLKDAAENGWLKDRVHRSRSQRFEEMDKHEQCRVGRNLNMSINEVDDHLLPPVDMDYGSWEEPMTPREARHIEEVQRVRDERDVDDAAAALKAIHDAAAAGENVVRPIIEGWKADVTRGEMASAVRVGMGYEWDEWNMTQKPEWVAF
jgi:methylmalonyl-CoA mutase N-terminal domain/subunit